MSRKRRNKPEKNYNENVINELLSSLNDETDEADIAVERASDIKIAERASDIADIAVQPEPVRESEPEKPPRKKHGFFFALAIFMIVMSIIGVVSSVIFVVEKISDAVNSSSLKDEYTRFLLPVVANDIAPFENENDLSNTAKINCSIWNIMLNHDTSGYKLSETGEFLIPEYDVEYSCKEIFGSSSGLIHRTVGSSDMSFSYDSRSHVYSCPKDLRYLSYAPVITDMSQNGDTYTLTVDYYPPAMRFLSENMGIEASADKTMKYVINRYDGKNTLVAVQFTSDEVVD